jgi:antirestriction protein ArdC
VARRKGRSLNRRRASKARKFFAATGAVIAHGGTSAFYTQGTSEIRMPPFEMFREVKSCYATLAREATNWTKPPSRLDRDLRRKRWGDAGYAMEELVAELGAAFACANPLRAIREDDDSAAVTAV